MAKIEGGQPNCHFTHEMVKIKGEQPNCHFAHEMAKTEGEQPDCNFTHEVDAGNAAPSRFFFLAERSVSLVVHHVPPTTK
jgi:hypothetical protein